MNVIGLGNAGCSLASRFGEHEQYKIYKIDSSEYGGQLNYYQLQEKETFREYEESSQDLGEYFKNVKEEVLFITAGSGNTPGAALWILEHLQKRPLSILYVRPDLELLADTARSKERALRGILQEYGRSGLFGKVYLVDNTVIENFLDEISIAKYYDSLNDIIVSTMHMINVFDNSSPMINTTQKPLEVNRIATIGVVNFETGKENLFYPLDLVREKTYYYAINRNKLETDGSLIKKIKAQVKSKITEHTRVSYAVYPTDYEDDYVFCKAYTSKVQLEKSENNP
tara:strand:+ start:335 stop:1186 length:852 start_codon:yes stop_codon:yes gene_type:complete